MTKISEVLKTTKKKQSVHSLFEWDYVKEEPSAYCALGVLACNKNMIVLGRTEPTYDEILKAYEIPEDLISLNYDRELGFVVPYRQDRKSKWDSDEILEENPQNLKELIFILNDNAKLNFKEIGEFLETNIGL